MSALRRVSVVRRYGNELTHGRVHCSSLGIPTNMSLKHGVSMAKSRAIMCLFLIGCYRRSFRILIGKIRRT